MRLGFEHLATNGIRLHTALAGPPEGEPVILLHGFPEAWFCWEVQIEALAHAGFRVMAPDQRGYNLSDKPEGVASYRMAHLVADVLGLADGLGYERFCLAGHDWGGLVAWNLALRYPERVTRLAIANAPHPAVMARHLRSAPSQLRRSWYVFFFQLRGLPERLLKANNWRFLLSFMAADLTDRERDRYRVAWNQLKAMTSMINWYRASLRRGRRAGSGGRVGVPSLVLWGQRDRFLGHEMAQPSVERCVEGRLVLFEEASHWVLHDKADEVGRLLVEHFRA
jgi:pimeloyl-ACP methyl ester carboxylesterase